MAENTIEQILGKIERSNIGKIKEAHVDEYEQAKQFQKQLESGKLYTPEKRLVTQVAQNSVIGAKLAKNNGNQGQRIIGVRRLERFSELRPFPVIKK